MTLKPCVCGSTMPPELHKRGRRHTLRRLQCPLCGFHGAGGIHISTIYTNWNRAVAHAQRPEEATDGAR